MERAAGVLPRLCARPMMSVLRARPTLVPRPYTHMGAQGRCFSSDESQAASVDADEIQKFSRIVRLSNVTVRGVWLARTHARFLRPTSGGTAAARFVPYMKWYRRHAGPGHPARRSLFACVTTPQNPVRVGYVLHHTKVRPALLLACERPQPAAPPQTHVGTHPSST